jgi:hypothetical protein
MLGESILQADTERDLSGHNRVGSGISSVLRSRILPIRSGRLSGPLKGSGLAEGLHTFFDEKTNCHEMYRDCRFAGRPRRVLSTMWFEVGRLAEHSPFNYPFQN